MRRVYSRLIKTEEDKNLKSALILFSLAILFIVVIFFIGIPTLAKYTLLFSNIKKGSQKIDLTDKTAPPPPIFDPTIEKTNKEKFTISGKSEPRAKILLLLNDENFEIDTDSQGYFTKEFTLKTGINSFVATAQDLNGNKGNPTKKYTVDFDKTPPLLDIKNPSDGQNFYGPGEKSLTVNGSTDTDSSIYVNENIASVDNKGNFSTVISLANGQNLITINAADEAGNNTLKTLNVTFSE